MDHHDHVNLIRGGVANDNAPTLPSVWADFGSGTGAFTLALADLLSPAANAIIHSIDRDAGALNQQRREMRARFPTAQVTYHMDDFTRPIDLPPLDGVLMANALHFVKDKVPVLRLMYGYLKPGGRLIVVEYNTDQGNTWVPYPFSSGMWNKLASLNGFTGTHQLSACPSRFLSEIYSAISRKPLS